MINPDLPPSELRERIAELKSKWDLAQPLADEHSRRLWQKLRLEWNYHSNHIEGNTLTYGETELLIVQGRTTGQHELREYEEMKAHDVAIQHVRELAGEERPITEADIRGLNKLILKEPFWKEARTTEGQPCRKLITPGDYKTTPNNVQTATGETFLFKSPEETPGHMADLVSWFRQHLQDTSIDFASFLAAFHHRFSVIHPFDDGNGRTMRLLVNYALLRRGFVPIIIRADAKKDYLGALGAADAGNIAPFSQFMAHHIAQALELGLKAASGESLEEPEDWQKEMTLFVRDFALEETAAPPKSDQLLSKLYETSILELADAILAKTGPLRKVFFRIYARLRGGWRGPGEIEVELDRKNLKQILDHRLGIGERSVQFDVILEGFSSPKIDAFDAMATLTFQWQPYRYSIFGTPISAALTGLRYDHHLTAKQIDNVSSEVAKFLFEEVKKKTGSNHY